MVGPSLMQLRCSKDKLSCLLSVFASVDTQVPLWHLASVAKVTPQLRHQPQTSGQRPNASKS